MRKSSENAITLTEFIKKKRVCKRDRGGKFGLGIADTALRYHIGRAFNLPYTDPWGAVHRSYNLALTAYGIKGTVLTLIKWFKARSPMYDREIKAGLDCYLTERVDVDALGRRVACVIEERKTHD